ncbi:glucose-1-phosphate thymidylyltransferase [Streptomyces clavuligerus]|uniref:Glucose-1-phosphate thymidyltransferase n=1 Tax=Streptomyces clavuligerus TaxID=1901 RepID=B5GLJ2_STRCL|nr:glucose-1-phosphate thymidylyltransferase [Streptomyces clavuligerus]EDY47188.1 NDP-1-glucose synthase [Streptomyces clavuligerus]EFG04856.1 glucose-1-phosphate thymidyltransferase [Streptomyces clavuligerus]MBY6306701.1 glucose-1-phosphate thymidylyltransferase [Streptomyces clavuligerus]QCS10692.1 glucose-1-phosphate thymidylyltransferase [Streptomyces clavuligerus]QPJ97271.1 glucose-1-phosphate thymidylyltransferase [Streptomyces clavuligerus]
MKALVLAGGSGSRLRPLSNFMPKQLIPVANKPVLEYVLENIRELGITRIGLVVGGWADTIRGAVGDGSRFGAEITYLRQERPAGLAHAVRLARPFLGDDDFAMFLGDNLLPDGVAPVAADFLRGRPAAQVVVHKVDDPRDFGVVELDAAGGVRRLVEKPSRPRSDLALVGTYFFTSAVHRAVDAIRPSPRGELEITDAIQWLLEDGASVGCSEYGGYWKDTGRADDLLEANRRVLEGESGGVAGSVDAASALLGRVRIAPGARVVRSRITGPAIIGPGALVEDSLIGPHTAVGAGCRLRAVDLADAIVLEGTALAELPRTRGALYSPEAVLTASRAPAAAGGTAGTGGSATAATKAARA